MPLSARSPGASDSGGGQSGIAVVVGKFVGRT
jgi:hypothetical protein